MKKKLLSVVIIMSILLNSVIPHMAVFAECIDSTGENSIVEDESIIVDESSIDETLTSAENDKEQSASVEYIDKEIVDAEDTEDTEDTEDDSALEKEVATSSEVAKEKTINIDENQLFGDGVSYTIPYNWYPTDATARGNITKITIKKGGDVPTGVENVISGELKYYEDGTEIVIYCPDANDNILMGEYYQYAVSGVFTNFSSVTEIEGLNSLDTSNVINASRQFSNCSSLSSLDLGSFNTSNVTTMSNMFDGCSGLTSLDLSNFDTSNVTDMTRMFADCSNLTNIDLSSFDISNVTTTGGMFIGCSSLINLDLNSLNTGNVTNMGAMFDGCSGLTSLDVSNFNTGSVTNMNSMFKDCRGLTSINLSNFNTANVTSMGDMFFGCSGLTSLDLSSFSTSNVANMSSIFAGCSALISLNLSGFNTTNVANMSGIFSDCSSLTSLDVSSFDTGNATQMSGMFSGCAGLTSLDLSSFNTSNTTNMSRMFFGCSGLTSLDLSSFNTANVTNMYGMFAGCSGFASLDLDNFDTNNVTDMSEMFSSCSGLTSVDLSGFDTTNVTNMYGMFSGCSGLTSLDLDNFNTNNVTDVGTIFSGCSSLTSIDLSGFNTSNVTTMLRMFYGCSSLTSLNLSNFDTANVTSMAWMFRDCSSLISLDISNFDISNVTSAAYIFYECTPLTHIKISDSFSSIINDVGLRGDWKDLGTGITYTHDTSGRTTIPTGGGEYQRVDSYTIDFYRNGGDWVAPYVAPSTRLYTEGVILPTSDNIVKANNVFKGWYMSDGSITGNWDETSKRTEIQANTEGSYIFYARWNPIYLVTFEMREGEMTDTAEIENIPANQNVESETCATRPTPNPSSNGFRFDGWYTDNTFTAEFNFSDAITGPTTIYAKWHRVQMITFNFDLNGHGSNFIQQVAEDTRIVKPANPTAAGYIFEYWYENNINVPFDFTQIISLTSGNPRTLKAKWKVNSGGGSRTGGNGGSGGGGGANTNALLTMIPINYVSQEKMIREEINLSQVTWVYDPISNKYKMNITKGNQTVAAKNGCYIVNNIVEQNINGIVSKNLVNSTYFFDEEGNMLTGWIKTPTDKWYFAIPDKTINEGQMAFGWRRIQDKWYYFTPEGRMLVNAITPDGYQVGADGARIE